MGKKKTARRGGSDVLTSPRGKQTGQEEPVTDTVMQVIARRVRNARKKLQKVSTLEAMLREGQTLNEDQERVYKTGIPLTAIIEELLKLEPLVEAALGNELAEHLDSAKDEWKREQEAVIETEPQPEAAIATTLSEEGDSETTVEGPLRALEAEEAAQPEEEILKDASTEASTDAVLSLDHVVETLYFLQLFALDRFDLTPLIGSGSTGVLLAEEIETIEHFGKKIFPTTPHSPQDAQESAKDSVRTLQFQSDPAVIKVFEIVSKLKRSATMDQELKLKLHGFPLAIEPEVSETTTERTDKSEEKFKQESQTVSQPLTEQEPPSNTDDNPPPSSPAVSRPTQHPEPVPIVQKTARPFLPFPGVTVTDAAPLRFGMGPPLGVHAYYSVAPVPGHFVGPPHYPMAQPPPMDAPGPSHRPEPEPEHPTEEPSSEQFKETEPASTHEAESAPPKEDAVEEGPPEGDIEGPQADTSTPDVAAEVVENEGPSVKPRNGNPPHQRSTVPGGGRFNGGPPSGGGSDYRPWQSRGGRYSHSGGRGGPRGRGHRGRHSYPYNGPPRRPPYDPQQPQQQQPPPHRPPFMQSAGGERHPYDQRARQRRGGYDRTKDVGSHS